ncbi:DNA-binding transcriptional regulator, ArsR family [Cryobacterium flavum]|uniref:ArsR family transcriptional regulator n=1 Tax=Cryobacterium flavum TaxID=1424659 RepID=A0A4R8V243_9MICO|nr:ArsR family transcriptional regulator [Cryobacterium flavum]SDO04982.1 DNA-binding transcriptional regulator, ArsR family [Cryobacterium flavum]
MHADAHGAVTYDIVYLLPAVDVVAELANPVRMKIILALRETEMSANHLADIVDGSPRIVARQLARPSAAGIVAERNHGLRVFYCLANEHVADLAINGVLQAQHAVPTEPDTRPSP